MPNDQKRISRQIALIECEVGDKFFDTLGPYDYSGFREVKINVRDFGLGWMRCDVLEYSSHSETWPDSYSFGPELLVTTWIDVICSWDPEEIDNPVEHRFTSLRFEATDEIDFSSTCLDDQDLPNEILESSDDYVIHWLFDGWCDEFGRTDHSIASFIEKQPEYIRCML